jgi:hypothetical protein
MKRKVALFLMSQQKLSNTLAKLIPLIPKLEPIIGGMEYIMTIIDYYADFVRILLETRSIVKSIQVGFFDKDTPL